MAAQDKADMNAIMANPEVQRAIAEAAGKAAADAVAAMGKGNLSEETRAMFSEMALAIATMGDQGSGRAKPVAPDEMLKRQNAARACEDLLQEIGRNLREAQHAGDEARKQKWLPEYRVMAKVCFNERMIDPWRRPAERGAAPVPQEIYWDGMPNDSLSPLNPIAEQLFGLYRQMVGLPTRLKSLSGPNGGQIAPDNRPYWLTPGGLVVKGDPPPRAFSAPSAENDVRMGPPGTESPFVNVLGTVHRNVQRDQAQPRALQ